MTNIYLRGEHTPFLNCLIILRKSFNEKLVGSDYESDVGTLFGYDLNLFGF